MEDKSFVERALGVFEKKTQSALAEALGVRDATVSAWRHGTSAPSVTEALRLARLLGVSLHWLMTGEGSPNVVTPWGDLPTGILDISRVLAAEGGLGEGSGEAAESTVTVVRDDSGAYLISDDQTGEVIFRGQADAAGPGTLRTRARLTSASGTWSFAETLCVPNCARLTSCVSARLATPPSCPSATPSPCACLTGAG